jgi:hypothetical protein
MPTYTQLRAGYHYARYHIGDCFADEEEAMDFYLWMLNKHQPTIESFLKDYNAEKEESWKTPTTA